MWIDHLVWYNSDLAEGRRFFGARMDCQPLYGGEHPGEGTANAVMALGPSTYLEILGRDKAQGTDALDREVKNLSGSGLYHWAVGGVDLPRIAERARLAGLQCGPLVPGGRVKPDGSYLEWTCWGLRDHDFGSLMPFFIDWRGNEHPAVPAPHGGKLVSLEVHCPRAEELRRLFDVLDLAIMVKTSETSGVVAVLESEKGQVELRSFQPVPRGYQI